MNTHDALQRELVEWMADAALGTTDDGAFDPIVTATGRRRPRPRWLALIKEPPMRLSNRIAVGSPMARLTATAATGLTLALVLAGAVFAASPSPEVHIGASPIPSASPSTTADPRAAAYVTGTLGPVDFNSDGVGTAQMVTSSDPRIGGVFTSVGNGDEYPGGIRVSASRTEIRGDDGAWVGTGTGYTAEGDLETLELTGEGAYAGLTAYLVLDWGTPGRPFKGIIFPGEMPQPPPAP